MILPTKHISIENSLIVVGAQVLNCLRRPQTVSNLWDKVRSLSGIGTFERFSLILDLLYMMGAIIFEDGLIRRQKK